MTSDNAARVLLVDDDSESQEIYTEMLRWAGFEVETAADGDSAVASAAAHPPDAVVLDIQMPGRDGIAVLRDLQALPQTAAVPVLALTGFADAADRARMTPGFCGVLEKPCNPHALVARLRDALARVRSPSGAA